MLECSYARGEEAQGAEYWRREADRLQVMVYALEDRIAKLTAPGTMVFQGVEGGVAYERSLVRIPEDAWDLCAEMFPQRKSWDWVADCGVLFLLSPVVPAVPPRREEAARNE